MHIVQCYELEEKSAEGYFKGVLRDTTTIGRWTLEVTSNKTSLLRLAEVVYTILKPECKAFESLNIEELYYSFKKQPIIFKKEDNNITILKFIIDADFALCYNSPEMNKGVHEVWPHGRLFFISFKKVRPMK